MLKMATIRKMTLSIELIDDTNNGFKPQKICFKTEEKYLK